MGYSIFDATVVDMTWPDIEKAAAQGAIVLLPVGIIEEHGPHMGLAVDTYVAYLVSTMAKRELESRGVKTLIAPPYYWGISAGTATFGGTFSVRKETMKAVLYDMLISLNSWGLKRVFTVNWHADHRHVITMLEAIKEAHDDTGMGAYCVLADYALKGLRVTGEEDYVLVQEIPPIPTPASGYVDLHAGSLETGIMLKYFPEQVDAAMAKNLKATELTYRDLKALGGSDSEVRQTIPQGYFGDPAGYDMDVAERFVEDYAMNLSKLIESFIQGNYRPPTAS